MDPYGSIWQSIRNVSNADETPRGGEEIQPTVISIYRKCRLWSQLESKFQMDKSYFPQLDDIERSLKQNGSKKDFNQFRKIREVIESKGLITNKVSNTQSSCCNQCSIKLVLFSVIRWNYLCAISGTTSG